MSEQRPYGSPQALRNAVTDRLRAIANPKGRWTLAELQRQFAYDRLLARLYTVDDQWVLKGAVGLLARQISVRHSTDIDVYRDAERSMVERELRAAAELDLRDWFQFEIGPAEMLTGGTGGARYPVTARVGATVWASFHIDIVGTGVRMTDVPEDVPPVARISVPGLDHPGHPRLSTRGPHRRQDGRHSGTAWRWPTVHAISRPDRLGGSGDLRPS
jgi:hypothetical protein